MTWSVGDEFKCMIFKLILGMYLWSLISMSQGCRDDSSTIGLGNGYVASGYQLLTETMLIMLCGISLCSQVQGLQLWARIQYRNILAV